MNTIEKLERIISNLKDCPLEFDIRNWDCGTACCAIGASFSDPDFNALGFYGQYEVWMDQAFPIYKVGFETYDGFTAVSEFLDLSEEDVNYLFHPTFYQDNPSKDTVIGRIQNYIERFQSKQNSPE